MSDRAHGSIEGGASLEDVKLGDTIIVITERESMREAVVTGAGSVWVTALGTRFRRDTGQAASRYSRLPCAMTVAENDRREETRRVLGVLRAWGLERSMTAVRELTREQLRLVAALLEHFEDGDFRDVLSQPGTDYGFELVTEARRFASRLNRARDRVRITEQTP